MTSDGYRLRDDLQEAYNRENELLYQYFSQFTCTDYTEEWQQVVIKYLYRKLSVSIRSDRGLGVGKHPWEEKPARTMLVEESILADRILNAVNGVEAYSRNEPYRKAMKNANIDSASWNCVGCIDDEEAITKLNIISKQLLDVKVSSRLEMVLCRYVGGLRKVAEYQILSFLGYADEEAMGMLKTFPF